MNFHIDDESEPESEEEILQLENLKLFYPNIESIHSRREVNDKKEFFIKFQYLSFRHCKWLEEEELLDYDPNIKKKLKRFIKDFEYHQSGGKKSSFLNYDKKYLCVDRVLSSSELFPVIHPKKASQIKNKWSEKLLDVMRILVNFESENVFYGVHFLNLCELYPDFPEIEINVDFSVIINRIYLDYYTSPSDFWKDILIVFDNLEKMNHYEINDRSDLIYRLKEISKFSFRRWKEFHKKELEDVKVFFRAKYSEMDFNDFMRDFYKIFSLEGNNNSGKFFAKLNSHIENYKVFLPNYDEIKLLLEKLKEKGNNLQKLIKSKKPVNIIDKNEEKLDNIMEEEKMNLSLNNLNNSMEEEIIEVSVANLKIEKQNELINEENKVILKSTEQNLILNEEKNRILNQKKNEEQKMELETKNDNQNNQSNIENEKIEKENKILDDEIKKEKLNLKKLITDIQILINQNLENFQILFKKIKNPHLKLIYGPLQEDLGIFLEEGPLDLTWMNEEELEFLFTNQKYKAKYFIKWDNLSYINSTWETGDILKEYPEKLKNFYRFNRALLKEARKDYLERYNKNLHLSEIKSNTRKFSRQHPSHIYDLRKKIFGFKDMKNIFKYQPKNQPVYKGKRMLRDYQLESLNWMINAWTKRRNIILADEMGLGKTIQAMAFINHLVFVEKLSGPFMIIAPLSTLQHWKRVFLEWSYLNTILYYDNNGKNGRSFCRDNEWYRYDVTQKGNFTKHYNIIKFQVLITSFEVFIQDFDIVFKDIPFQKIIIDEAHRLKNKNAKIIKMLRRLVCNRIFLLTGTPIQNNITELWSLLNFIEPNQFDDLNKFKEKFDDLTNCGQLDNLKNILKPYLLRRMKEDVETSIPPLKETIIDIELTNIQKMVYKTVYEKSKGTLQKGLGLKFVSMMNNLEIQLRKCCNHPFLLTGIKENLLEGAITNKDYFEKIENCSGKMIFLDKMIVKFQKENKKILIFSQFTEMLKIIEEYLSYKGIHFEKIDGSTKAKDRQSAIDRFNNNPKFFEVFLLSTKAGGIGINLTSAKIVIIYDSDWNPQNDVQAIARAHRIGQTEEVKVFRMVSKRTYEAEMFERSSKKLGLDQAIFLSKTFTTMDPSQRNEEMTKLKPKEIELLLRKGMLGLLEEEKGKPEDLANMDIDEVIKNARVANYSFTKGTYSFAKGNFNTTAKENKVLLDDPDFWKKVFVNSDTPADKIRRKYEELKKNKLIKILDYQKQFFFQLSSEMFKYMTDRIKNEGYCEETERKFNELLLEMEDSSDLHEIISEVIHHLAIDFKKQSRRIKKYDAKYLNALFRKRLKNDKRKTKVIRRKDFSEEDDMNNGEEYKDPKNKGLNIYHESGSEYENDYKIKKKRVRIKVNTKLCDLCSREKPDFICSNFCQRPLHRKCLKEKMDSLKSEIKSATNKKFDNENVKDECGFCKLSIAQCFDCKSVCKVENNGKITDLRHEKSLNFLYKCNLCCKFYHLKCLTREKISIKKKKFSCAVHTCNGCGELSNDLFCCQECPMSFHKKCLSKRNRIVRNNVILCYNHKKNNIQTVKPKKSNKKSQDNFDNILIRKRNKLIKGNSRSNKKLKLFTGEKNEDYYKKYNITKPEEFNYMNYNKVN